ncbi:MAG: RnfABCDGE type electron transport complex subunit D [Flavobacteriales bacterium]|nr:RnfABCDGE type electron transport complex subunit D [Flavobacteriales bacterium]
MPYSSTLSLSHSDRKSLDPRDFQIVFLASFLLYGIIALDWAVEWDKYVVLLVTAVVVQLGFEKAFAKSKSSWKSAVITALGLSLLLKSGELWVLALAITLAIASKFLLRMDGKHVFNPGNFGIVAVLLLTGEAWVSPGQWGSGIMLLLFFGSAAAMVLLRVGRIDTCLTFLITYGVLEYIRTILYLGWTHDVFFHKMCNGSFLLFTFFMITDPVTTPNAPKARILWAVTIGGLAFFLSNWMYISTAPIWALIIVAPLTAVLDRKFKHQLFQWNR